MTRAKIENGIWTRIVSWVKGDEYRTDIFKSTLADNRLRFAKFVLKNGPIVLIPVHDLRRAVEGGRDHYNGKIWGPFNINLKNRTVNGIKVEMDS